MVKLFSQVAALALVLATSLVAMADPVGGPKGQVSQVEAYSSRSFSIECWGGEWTGICIEGDGDTDLDLYVYDMNGNLVAEGESYSDSEELFVLCHTRQTLTITIVNRGSVYNRLYIYAW